MTDTLIGAQGESNSPYSWTERDEIAVWTLIMRYLDKEKRTDGEAAYVVRDMGDLLTGIMEFYEEKNNNRSK